MHELRALVDAYAVAVDERDVVAFCSLFAHDAVLRVVEADGSERGRYEGIAQLAEVPAKLARYDRTMHLVATHHVQLDGDRATGVAYCEAHHHEGGVDRVRYIRYDDRYVRTVEGWRFHARTVHTIWIEER